jgi:ribosomal protein S18 acetylase RimI-like enzyme
MNVWVFLADGTVRGYLAMDDAGYVDRLYIDPHSQRRGIGTALIAHAAELAPRGLRLFTHVENHAARAFYERLGFRAIRFGVSPPPESAPDVEYVRGDPPRGP